MIIIFKFILIIWNYLPMKFANFTGFKFLSLIFIYATTLLYKRFNELQNQHNFL